MGDTYDNLLAEKREHVIRISTLLADARAKDTVALDVHEMSGFADFFVIATVTSQGHQRGLVLQLDELFRERGIEPIHPRRRNSEVGWVLIDLGFVIVHLMNEEMREFYELERLWFGAKEIYSSFDSEQT